MRPPAPLQIGPMRSPLGRVRGLGAARTGAHHWWTMRLSSLALLPLTLWFIVSILRLTAVAEPQMRHWAHRPVNTVLLLALIITTFHHLQAGLTTVIEDYSVAHTRLTLMLVMKAGVALLALAAIVAILKLAL